METQRPRTVAPFPFISSNCVKWKVTGAVRLLQQSRGPECFHRSGLDHAITSKLGREATSRLRLGNSVSTDNWFFMESLGAFLQRMREESRLVEPANANYCCFNFNTVTVLNLLLSQPAITAAQLLACSSSSSLAAQAVTWQEFCSHRHGTLSLPLKVTSTTSLPF